LVNFLAFLAPVTAYGLGVWQLYRLQWKLDLIKRRSEHLGDPPLELPSDLSNPQALANLEFRPVYVTGQYLHNQENYLQPRLYERLGEKLKVSGYHVLTPFLTKSGQAVLINRGWIPKDKISPSSRPEGQVEGETSVVGIARTSSSKPNWFTPKNSPQMRMWFWIDFDDFASYTSPPINKNIYIEAGIPSELSKHKTERYPIGGQSTVSLRNQHLNYAITWFTLGVCLSFMSLRFVRRRVEGRLY